MIIGIGVDTVDIVRFTRQLERNPRLEPRLFTAQEARLPMHSKAARFAAKEALIKALGASDGLAWHDMEVPSSKKAAPAFARTDALMQVLAERRASWPHLSMSHDGGIASAIVVAEG